MTEKQRQKKKNRKAKDACFGEADGVLDLASAPFKRIASKSRKAEKQKAITRSNDGGRNQNRRTAASW